MHPYVFNSFQNMIFFMLPIYTFITYRMNIKENPYFRGLLKENNYNKKSKTPLLCGNEK